MRIAIAGICHEALNSSPVRTTLQDFHVWRGEEILDKDDLFVPYPAGDNASDNSIPVAEGLDDRMRGLGVEPVPILLAMSIAPSGVVEEKTYLQLRDEIVDGVRQAGKLDGVCLILHGALLVENVWSGETDLVREIRAVIGYDPLIAVRFDMHANLTEEFANKTDLWTAYRTAPHRDAPETLMRAMGALVHSLRSAKRPRPVFIRLPLLLPGERSTTDVDPMNSLLEIVADIEQQPGILTADLLVGFAWADAPHTGSNVVVVAEDEVDLPLARQQARRLAQAMWDRRNEFTFDVEVATTVDEAIDLALEAPENSVFLSDSGDNVTAGTPGDVPYFLSRLLARQVPDAIVAGIPDPAAVRSCFEQGKGATVTLTLGGRLDRRHGDPLEVTGVVEHLYQPQVGVKDAAVATLRIGGVRVLVTDLRKAFTTQDDFRRAGIEPLEHKIVVVKLGYLMPELRDVAPREILVLTSGLSDLDLKRLPYRYVTRPIFPLDGDFTWQPIITNTAGYGG